MWMCGLQRSSKKTPKGSRDQVEQQLSEHLCLSSVVYKLQVINDFKSRYQPREACNTQSPGLAEGCFSLLLHWYRYFTVITTSSVDHLVVLKDWAGLSHAKHST